MLLCSFAIKHEEACPAYAHFPADQAQQVGAAADATAGAATVKAAATGGALTYMVKPTMEAPSIRDSGLHDGVWEPRISRKGGTTVDMKGGLAGLPATRQPKEQKDRVHAKIDLKGGDSVRVRWGKTAGRKRHKTETYEATMVEIDRAQIDRGQSRCR